jgi:hypothetical protein
MNRTTDSAIRRTRSTRGLRSPRSAWSTRVLVAGVAGALAAAGALAPAVPASAEDPEAASANSRWLADQLVDGRFVNPLGGGDDEGLMIDALYAMHASGDGELAAPILDVLDNQDGALNYISYYEFLGEDGAAERIGGATAKTLLAAEIAGADPRDFGGLDLVAETQRVVVTPEDVLPGGRFAPDAAPNFPVHLSDVGRVTDFGPNTYNNNANTFGQVLAVIALAAVDDLPRSVLAKLLWQQCSEGYFRIFYSYSSSTQQVETCDEGKDSGGQNSSPPDGDTTGFGLAALLAARRLGVTDIDDRIQAAVTWLADAQDPSGGWGGGVGTEAPNTNSTGLVVQALAEAEAAGFDLPATTVPAGEAYLKSAQVTAADAGNDLAGELGAIAYRPESYLDAREGGIGNLDQWIRASAQASLGVSQTSFTELAGIEPSDDPPLNNQPAALPGLVTTTHRQPVVLPAYDPDGDRITVEVTEPATGTVTTGLNSVTYTPPSGYNGTDTFGYRITDSFGGVRTGTVSVEVAALPAARLAVQAPTGYVGAGTSVTVRASGLADGETYTVTLAGRNVGTGVATATGTVTRKVTVPASTPAGTRPVVVRGATAQRTGTATVRVLTAKKLRVSTSRPQVRRGTQVKVSVAGLAAGERFTLRAGGALLRGTATGKGTATRTVRLTALGQARIVVVGQLASRRGSRVVKVVR